MASDPWGLVAAAASAIAEHTGIDRHEVAVVLGSGWADAAGRIGTTVAEVPMAELPGFAPPSVAGHANVIRSVRTTDGRPVLVLLGRVHGYEGHPLETVVHGVRTAVKAGCHTVLLTNAAGGLRDDLRVGQPVLLCDQLNLTGQSPLTGLQSVLPRFVDMTDAFSPRLRDLARSLDPLLVEGVYAGVAGPQYETPAEIRMLQRLGADLVGMSTVHEVVAARHVGAEVLGLSLVTNLAAGLGDGGLDHADVVKAGQGAAGALGDLLAAVAARA